VANENQKKLLEEYVKSLSGTKFVSK
jgi:hypothetical protein